MTLHAHTVALDTQSAVGLVAASGLHSSLAWIRDGEGMVGWGEAARFDVAGPERFSRATRWWSAVCASMVIKDEVEVPGTGPVAFASFAFSASPGDSVLILPRVVIGTSGGQSWVTRITSDDEAEAERWAQEDALFEELIGQVEGGEVSSAVDLVPVDSAKPGMTWESGTVTRDVWKNLVELVIERINSGEVDKVVLARDIVGQSDGPIEVDRVLARLASRFDNAWVFHIDGFIGATPELLVRRAGDQVVSRVLAGTVRSGGNLSEAGRLAQQLMGSDKDQEEHQYAVSSVASVLATHCTDLTVPPYPSILKLANVQHLSTDVSGQLVDDMPALTLAASLHPTAAVCGTPTERALWMIKTVEGLDRGHYAGPVGWMDANGDGEFGIALRCGQIDPADPSRIQLFAGCGIVAGSNPDSEVAESEAKMLAMQNALSG
ncbi:MAG: isochorismate synthase [Candidatus Nanopelagicales bacterium]